jgi:hypothetical protein
VSGLRITDRRHTPKPDLAIESEVQVACDGDTMVTCKCGREFWLYFNGGEMDRRECACGRVYETEIRSVCLITKAPVPRSARG